MSPPTRRRSNTNAEAGTSVSSRKEGRGKVKSLRYYPVSTSLGVFYVLAIDESPVRIILERPPKGSQVRKDSPRGAVKRFVQAVSDFVERGEIDAEITRSLLRLPGFTAFQRDVYGVVVSIPRGRTLSYGEVAEKAGHPRAARAVGTAMRRNPFPLLIPCHRVIRSDGRLGDYSGPPGMKARLLELEGAGEGSRQTRRRKAS